MKLAFTLNSEAVSLEDVPPSATLLDVLRDHLKLTGTRLTCGIGICGACTVVIDGDIMSGCLLLAPMLNGRSITTIEGLSGQDDPLECTQQAFVDAMGLQCSYCTPGFVLATRTLLAENPAADEHAIKEYLAGNLCRCGSYYKILDAVKLAQQRGCSE
jgi:aerobic-type carbon monoxide dehydrogenase small subunit (CoxS/CutS family)